MPVIYDEGMGNKVIKQQYKITLITDCGFFFGMNMPKLGITSFLGKVDMCTLALLRRHPKIGLNGPSEVAL